MKIPSPGFLVSAFFQAFVRFPGAMASAIGGTILLIGLIENHGNDQENFLTRTMITCLLGLSFMTALVAFGESRAWNKSKIALAQLIGFLLLTLCWFWLDTKMEHFEYLILPKYLALLLVMHLAVAVAPFLNHRSVQAFWDYNRNLFANFVIGAAFTFILFIGLALALLAVDQLFGVRIQDEWYVRLFVLLAGIFNTAYFLFHFPELTQEDDQTDVAYSWVFRNLCKFILIPIVLLYFLILYAFGAKIGLEWELPEGWISSLVLGFSVAGIFTYLLNFYLSEEDKSTLVVQFKRWFWWVLLPLTGLLFLAIGRRIGDYGVTEERFLVATLGVWLLLNCLYFLISKTDNLKFIPISLGLFALAWAFGPLSALSVSMRSQTGILTEILERNERFAAGSLKPGNKPLTDKENGQVYSAILFLSQRNALAPLLPVAVDTLARDYGQVLEWLNVGPGLQEGAIRTLNLSAEDYTEPMSVQGFDLDYRIDLFRSQKEDREIKQVFMSSPDGLFIEWWDLGQEKPVLIESFSLKPTLDRWVLKMDPKESYNYANLSMAERSILLNGKKGNLRLVLENGQVDVENNQPRLESANCWILLKKK
ncbi:MAG: DUF4153 domain-containing protein [Saprospiraceae bacterium]|nr:DUF4153 domain-containing protein [Saprospiraceae bacterium]